MCIQTLPFQKGLHTLVSRQHPKAADFELKIKAAVLLTLCCLPIVFEITHVYWEGRRRKKRER